MVLSNQRCWWKVVRDDVWDWAEWISKFGKEKESVDKCDGGVEEDEEGSYLSQRIRISNKFWEENECKCVKDLYINRIKIF